MILKRLILVLLAMFLVMGCAGAVSAEDISNVAISVTEPSTGIQPSSEVSITQGTADSLSWSPADALFAPGKNYRATVMVSTDFGNNFTESITATINNHAATVTRNSNISLTVTYEFGATEMSSISTVDLVLPSPRTGEKPITASSDTKGVGTPSVSWSPSATTFNANEVYTATITVPAAPGYLFGDSPTVKVNNMNGEKITVAANKKSLTAECSFPETTSIEISSPIALTLTPPTTGSSPTSPSSTTTGVGTPTVVWSPSVGTFVEGQVYYANITIPVSSTNYIFTSSSAVTLNGGDVSSEIVNRTGNQIILNHSFDATSLKTRIGSVNISGVTAPVYGANPVTSAASSTDGISSVSVSWSPFVSSKFAADTTYNATIIARITDSRYAFSTSTPSVSLNGATASTANVTRNSDTEITIVYTFEKTESKILPTITLSTNITNNIGTVPLSVKFTYTATNFDNCTLIYGDGASSHLTSSSGNITHTYTTAGSYTASLIAKNLNGTTYENRSITVNKVGLAAAFTASHESGMAPLVVLFIDKSAGSPIKWVWDFGGLGSSMDKNPTFNFTKAGTYIVKLTVIDSTGATDSYSRVISVKAPLATSTPTQTAAVKSLTTASAETGNMSMIPAPLDIIKEFMHLFYSIFDPANYLFAVNESGNTS
ncbi:PKD domain-containing protein [Methanocorpusculum sp. GPch4]|uniref:PKD domain-containing protein n=1 Tax=Methanocorpusculum sp. GPch4 TaxID=2527877 RepID=UPI001432D34A|nr:PKD domain-containing protein [Methanocorpusculum sp. GPch4]